MNFAKRIPVSPTARCRTWIGAGGALIMSFAKRIPTPAGPAAKTGSGPPDGAIMNFAKRIPAPARPAAEQGSEPPEGGIMNFARRTLRPGLHYPGDETRSSPTYSRPLRTMRMNSSMPPLRLRGGRSVAVGF